jgi:hypothetical protein
MMKKMSIESERNSRVLNSSYSHEIGERKWVECGGKEETFEVKNISSGDFCQLSNN